MRMENSMHKINEIFCLLENRVKFLVYIAIFSLSPRLKKIKKNCESLYTLEYIKKRKRRKISLKNIIHNQHVLKGIEPSNSQRVIL